MEQKIRHTVLPKTKTNSGEWQKNKGHTHTHTNLMNILFWFYGRAASILFIFTHVWSSCILPFSHHHHSFTTRIVRYVTHWMRFNASSLYCILSDRNIHRNTQFIYSVKVFLSIKHSLVSWKLMLKFNENKVCKDILWIWFNRWSINSQFLVCSIRLLLKTLNQSWNKCDLMENWFVI